MLENCQVLSFLSRQQRQYIRHPQMRDRHIFHKRNGTDTHCHGTDAEDRIQSILKSLADPLLQNYAFCNFSIAASIRAIVSSFPSTSISSVAPPGVICLPETAVRIGHIT